MSEAILIAWFTSHPFTHTLCIAIAGSIAASIKHDRATFGAEKATNPQATFLWRVALRNYAIGGSMAGGAVIGAEILHVLSS